MLFLFTFQMICAFGPGLLGLVLTAVLAPQIFRRLRQVLQFDLTTVMLFTVAFAFLFTILNAIRNNPAMDGLFVLSIFTMPGIIFARLFIDTLRDERRSRAERQRKEEKINISITPASLPPDKPQ